MPSVLEDVCIKLLTAAENDPALADLPFHPGAVRFYRAMSTPAILALQQATHTVPIVFVQVIDPVGAGMVANLA